MKKTLFSGLLLMALSLFMVSCANETSADQAAARAKVESTTPTAPATPTAQPAPNTPAAPVGPTTVMEFGETEFDFGTVTEGEKVSHTYAFKNTGSEPLILSNAKGSCGCTVPKWPKEPIAPGASGEITVEFNSKNKKGPRNQKVTITANTEPAQTFIYLKGNVEPDPNAPAPTTPNAPAQPNIQINQ